MTFKKAKEALDPPTSETTKEQGRDLWLAHDTWTNSIASALRTQRQDEGGMWGTCKRKGVNSGAAVEVLATAQRGVCGHFDQQMVN